MGNTCLGDIPAEAGANHSRCCKGLRPSLQVEAATHHLSDPIAAASLAHAATGSTAGSTTAAGSSSGALLRGGGRALRLLGL